MRELGEGLWHWQARHPGWEASEPWDPNVSSYAIDDGTRLLLFDPIAPPEEIEKLAAERGVTHARLNLKPVELGGIEVRLQSTPQGVSAQLVADSPEAARMLTQASDDLRRQLADRNVNLLSLDVSTSSDQRQVAE